MITLLRARRIISTVPKRYPPEFRRKVLDLVAAGRRVAQVAADLDISEQTIYVWRRRELVAKSSSTPASCPAPPALNRPSSRPPVGASLSSRPRSRSIVAPPSC